MCREMESTIMMPEMRRGLLTVPLLFLLGAAALGEGCGGNVSIESSGSAGSGASGTSGSGGSGTSGPSGTSTGTSSSSGSSACPTVQPSQGDACPVDNQTCFYDSGGCGSTEAECDSSREWLILSPQPPACGCPAELPTAGTACNPCCEQSCSYAPPGQCGPSATCSPSGFWTVSIPPCPPPLACSDATTPGACASVGNYRWLVPGCALPSIFTAGCFDAADCVVGSGCPSGQSCFAVDTDPCWDSNCTVCAGGKADICAGPG